MTCPICDKPADKTLRPFCSRRCADIDLSRWLKGGYAIPGAPSGEEDDAMAVDDTKPLENRGFRKSDKGMDRE